jgi:hypothetical protein
MRESERESEGVRVDGMGCHSGGGGVMRLGRDATRGGYSIRARKERDK